MPVCAYALHARALIIFLKSLYHTIHIIERFTSFVDCLDLSRRSLAIGTCFNFMRETNTHSMFLFMTARLQQQMLINDDNNSTSSSGVASLAAKEYTSASVFLGRMVFDSSDLSALQHFDFVVYNFYCGNCNYTAAAYYFPLSLLLN